MLSKKLLFFIIIMVAFGAGVYFSNNVKKIEIGSVLTKVGKELLTPPPLNIGGLSNKVVLLQSKIIEETNLQRQLNGDLPVLQENSALNAAASAKANDMFKNQYFEHVSPAGVDPGKLVLSYGYDYIIAGENLILGNFASEKEVIDSWMNSPGHRANILNNRYTEIGVAIIKGTYEGRSVWIGVQEFGLPLSTCSEPSLALKDQISAEKSQLDILSLRINERRKQIDDADRKSPAYNQMVNDYNQMIPEYNSLADRTKLDISVYNEQVINFNNCVSGK